MLPSLSGAEKWDGVQTVGVLLGIGLLDLADNPCSPPIKRMHASQKQRSGWLGHHGQLEKCLNFEDTSAHRGVTGALPAAGKPTRMRSQGIDLNGKDVSLLWFLFLCSRQFLHAPYRSCILTHVHRFKGMALVMNKVIQI
jgi:hypothetical protein